ncbi:MAG: hypothetical protein KC434_09365, partial [Anaerolineales bacterium]|nr:hypothetical protein [Anaerolineales bacterium]
MKTNNDLKLAVFGLFILILIGFLAACSPTSSATATATAPAAATSTVSGTPIPIDILAPANNVAAQQAAQTLAQTLGVDRTAVTYVSQPG